jgi:hypothetical protein
MPDDEKKKVVSTDHPLWKAILEQAEELQFGSFVVFIKAHAGKPRNAEIGDIRKRIREE